MNDKGLGDITEGGDDAGDMKMKVQEAMDYFNKENDNKGKEPPLKRRKLTAWNVFTKQMSLEYILGRPFLDNNEFLQYVVRHEEFKQRSKKDERRKRQVRIKRIKDRGGKVDTKGKKSQEDISKEFNDLPEDRLKGYESLANAITKLRDSDKL